MLFGRKKLPKELPEDVVIPTNAGFKYVFSRKRGEILIVFDKKLKKFSEKYIRRGMMGGKKLGGRGTKGSREKFIKIFCSIVCLFSGSFSFA